MAFQNVGSILGVGSPVSSMKLLLTAASSSRPGLKPACEAVLKTFSSGGEYPVEYRCYDRMYTVMMRLSDRDADFQSVKELALNDAYRLEPEFKPDVVVDGGGNIGLFTLRAAAMSASVRQPARLRVCEPLPRNIAQIRKHLALNKVEAELLPFCLGGERRKIPFYCRQANQSSFDGNEPYESVLEIGVVLLEDAIGEAPAERILIKLDIEGMEIEVLRQYVPGERRAVYVVGELHDVPRNQPLLEQIMRESGWTLELFDMDVETGSFRACSPSAVPLLRWAAAV